MAIEFECIACLSTLRVPDENKGKKARCPSCQTIVQIPGEASASQPPASNPYLDAGNAASNPYSNPNDPYRGNAAGTDFSKPATDLPNAPATPYATPMGGSTFPGSDNPYAIQSAANARDEGDFAVLQKVRAAGITMMVFNVLGLAFAFLGMIGNLIQLAEARFQEDAVVSIIFSMVLIAGQGLGAWGSYAMISQKNYGIAIAGVISTTLTGIFCCCLPSIVGVYGFVVLVDGRASAAMKRNS